MGDQRKDLILVKTIVIVTTLSSDGEPEGATMIDHEAVAGFDIQGGERSTVGVMAGGIDDIARTSSRGDRFGS